MSKKTIENTLKENGFQIARTTHGDKGVGGLMNSMNYISQNLDSDNISACAIIPLKYLKGENAQFTQEEKELIGDAKGFYVLPKDSNYNNKFVEASYQTRDEQQIEFHNGPGSEELNTPENNQELLLKNGYQLKEEILAHEFKEKFDNLFGELINGKPKGFHDFILIPQTIIDNNKNINDFYLYYNSNQ